MLTFLPLLKIKKVRILLIRWIVCSLLFLLPVIILADDIETTPSYDETSLTVVVEKVGTVEIPSVISGRTAYLSIDALFSFLKVKHTVTAGMDSVYGFFINPSDVYLISKSNNSIKYKGKEYQLKASDLIQTNTNLFLNIRYFQEIFGLECTFFLKSLSVNLKSRIELPIFREMRQEEMRKFIRQIKGEAIADTNISRSYPAIHLGTADWAIYSTQEINGKVNTRGSLALGGFLAGGETTLGLNYLSDLPLSMKNQYYRWRYVNNDNKFLRQVIAGKISSQSISSIFSPVIGIQLTNTPTSYRRFFGTYTLEDKTEPGWIVELYVNNTLIDYVKADASGFFKFEVPLAYGNTEVSLRYYGPWGEEKSTTSQIHIPFTFMPKNELEYTLSAGTTEDNLNVRFYRSSFNYGLTNKITIGGGYEFLSSITSGKNIPFVNTSLNIARNFLFTGEYAIGVKAKGLLTYRLPSNFIVELSYTKYDKNQKAIYYNYREERRGSISMPLRFRNISIYSRLTVNQMIMNESLKITLSDFIVSAAYKRFSGNLHTYGSFVNIGRSTIYSDLSMGYRLPWGINFTPTIRYNHSRNALTGWKIKIEKPLLKHGYLTMNYEQYTDHDIRNLQVGFRYVFSGVQAAVYANHHNNSASFSQAVSGSLVFDPATPEVIASNMNKVGIGGITLLPFLDMNCNGKRDKGEPKVKGLKVSVATGGQVVVDEKDTLIRIFNLEAYTKAHLEINSSHLGNISWVSDKKTFSVEIDPNIMKLLEIPVCVYAEVSGTISLPGSYNQEKIRMQVYSGDSVLVTTFSMKQDGYFNHLGLKPGIYIIQPDTEQMKALNLSCMPASRSFTVETGDVGDFVDGMNFMLSATDISTLQKEHLLYKEIRTETVPVSDDSVSEENVPETVNPETVVTQTGTTESAPALKRFNARHDIIAIQVGAFVLKSNANKAKLHLEESYKLNVAIVSTTGFYKVLIKGFNNLDDAEEMMFKLRKNGYPDAYLRNLRNGIIQE